MQALFKGKKIRRMYKQIMYCEKTYHSVKWTEGGNDIALIGSLTDPPWISKLRMDYCPLRKIYVKYFSKLNKGIYYFNYLINGEIKSSHRYPKGKYEGMECNILRIGIVREIKEKIEIPRAFSKDYTEGPTDWSKLKRVCSESSIELYKNQPAFQRKQIVESSGEEEMLNALRLAKSPQAKSPKGSSKKIYIEELKLQPSNKALDDDDLPIYEVKKQDPESSGGRAEINFEFAYGDEANVYFS